MDILLQKVTQQAMNYAIRSGIVITSSYAIGQCSRLLKTVKSEDREELSRLQHRLDSKIRIIAPAIDMIELIAARGNTSLESAVTLTKSLRWDIQSLGVRFSKAAADEENAKRGSSNAKSGEQLTLEVKLIIKDIKRLLDRLEDAVPLINLAITTSGVSLSTNLPPTVSPSRLLQASTFLSAGDSHYAMNPSQPAQIGPRFTLSVYMLFLGHSHQAVDEEGLQKVVWKEVIHKAQMKLVRIPIKGLDRFPFSSDAIDGQDGIKGGSNSPDDQHVSSDVRAAEFAYQLTMVEDLDDDRAHTIEEDEEPPGPVDDVPAAGIRTHIPIHEIAKIFYADTGKILNLGSEGESNNPILLLKRDPHAPAPRRLVERAEPGWDLLDDAEGPENLDPSPARSTQSESSPADNLNALSQGDKWSLPLGLDPEWVALEVYNEGFDSDDDSETEVGDASNVSPSPPLDSNRKRSSLASAFSSLRLTTSSSAASDAKNSRQATTSQSRRPGPLLNLNGPITTSLSLLEMLIRLTSLQQFQQSSHLAITDELLNFFLSEGSTTGAASGDAEARKRIRMEARQHVGFDPYDESPIKRRGEQYQHKNYHDERASASLGQSPTTSVLQSPLSYPRQAGSSLPAMTPRRSTPQRPSSNLGDTPPLPGSRARTEPPFPMTPPGTNKSRERFLKDELAAAQGARVSQSSPLVGEASKEEEAEVLNE